MGLVQAHGTRSRQQGLAPLSGLSPSRLSSLVKAAAAAAGSRRWRQSEFARSRRLRQSEFARSRRWRQSEFARSRHLSRTRRHTYSETAVREPEVRTDEPANGRSDAELFAQRAVQRDAQAWEAIFEQHWRSVFAFVRYRLRGADEAEDIASQAFEVAYSHADRFDYRGVPIEAWLMGIARNLCRDHIKKLGRRGYQEELDEFSGPSEPDASAAVDLHHDLRAAMHALTEDQQEVLSLRFLTDRSVEETAKLMNRSDDAVKNLQRRALAAMYRALASQDYPGASPP